MFYFINLAMSYNWLGTNMVPNLIAYCLSFVVLIIGSITDLKTREVPDWMNYGLILSGLGLNLLYTAIYSDSHFIINSIIGLAIFFGIAYIMFYAGQWGGGDSKMLMGLGAVIGVDVRFESPQFLAGFLINALFIGAIYGLLWSAFLVVKNKAKFKGEFSRLLMKKSVIKAKKIMLLLALLFLAGIFVIRLTYARILILSLAFLILTIFYLWIFVKAVEKTSMYKLVEPAKLTEGDWIVKDIIVDKQYICGPKDLGIEKRQIKKLIEFYAKGKIRKILIKEGIPFVPSFLIAFVVTFFVGNPLTWLL